MEQEEFDQLVKRLEPLAARSPAGYRLRLGLLGLLGYAVIFGILGVLLTLTVLCLVLMQFNASYLAVKALIFLGGLDILIVDSLRITVTPPVGLVLTRSEAGPLFDLVDEIRSKLDCPPVDFIILDNHFNAAMAYVPRLGVFGWMKNYLVVGLPLMQALGPEEFRAVMCHELAHLSRRHNRFGHWVYRIQKTWFQLLKSLEASRHRGSNLFARFFQWYAPYFFAYSFVLDRMVEYEADGAAAELAGARHAADALIQLEVRQAVLEKLWPDIYRQAYRQAAPPPAFNFIVPDALRKELPQELSQRWLASALEDETTSVDTHPALADRLRFLGQEPRVPPAPAESAAQRFLGSHLPSIAASLNLVWTQTVGYSWRDQFSKAQAEQAQLQELLARGETLPPTIDEAFERARFTERYRSPEEAIPRYRGVLAMDPHHPGALYGLGRALLSQADVEGRRFVEAAMDLEPGVLVSGSQLIYRFLQEHGQEGEARQYRKSVVERLSALKSAAEERAIVTDKDTFIPHNLAPGDLQMLKAQLARYRQVGRTFLVRKVLKHNPEEPLYILALHERFSMNSGDEQGKLRLRQILSQELILPGPFHVVILPSGNFQPRISGIQGARL